MTVDLLVVGKTEPEVATLVDIYTKRIGRYVRFSVVVIPALRGGALPEERQKREEGELILRQLGAGDHVVLLDDKGSERTSVQFAAWLQRRMATGATKRLVFVMGGAYGFSQAVYARADEQLSLSRMTFSHQIVRAIFAEQLYRAFTILGGEPYHHE